MANKSEKGSERRARPENDSERDEHPLAKKRKTTELSAIEQARVDDEQHEPELSEKGRAERPTSAEVREFAEAKYFVEPSAELQQQIEAEQERLKRGEQLDVDVSRPVIRGPISDDPQHRTVGTRLDGVEQQRNVVQVVRSRRERNSGR